MSWWVANDLRNHGPAWVLSWIVWVIASVVLHELAHGWAAIRCGDRTPIDSGHMTLNPLVHMGTMSLLMFALVGIAWGQMPVNPYRFRGPKDHAFVAFAGPATNLVLATIAILAGGLWEAFSTGVDGPFRANLANFFFIGAMLNVVLFVFNLIPIPPLDGATVLTTYSASYRRMTERPNFGQVAMILFVVIFFSVGQTLFTFAGRTANGALDLVRNLFS